MKPYPEFPEDWDNAENTLYREFNLVSTPDIECLIRLVKEGLYDGGNEGILRARLLGILYSYFSRANARFWERHYHPRTWRLRIFWRNAKRKYHRFFNTRHFKSNAQMCNIAREVANEMIKKHKL